MHELRPDSYDRNLTKDELEGIDDRVIAPTEPLDDRDSRDPEFRVDEELSCSNTGYGKFSEAL